MIARERQKEGRRYEDRYISFIDILGFADLISRSEEDSVLVSGLYDALLTAPKSSPIVGPPWYPKGFSYGDMQATHFSDSIVLSAERTPQGLMTVLELSRAFACVLIQNGLLSRGGVAGGKVVHTDHVLFGPGMVQAYRIESKEARFARIILDEDCAAVARDLAKGDDPIGEYFRETLRTDLDGALYIHVLRELEIDVRKPKPPQYAGWWWGRVRETLIDYLKASEGQPYRDKVEWFCAYFDRCVGGAGGDCEDAWRSRFHLEAPDPGRTAPRSHGATQDPSRVGLSTN